MKYRKVPGTDLELSVVGFGCWAIGGRWWGDDVRDETSIAAVHKALDLGINWFDTAPLYGYAHADEVLARALGPRIKDVVVATKVGIRYEGRPHPQSDLHPEHIRSDTEASLKRLGVERIDLLQVHWPCELGTPLEASLEALTALQREGKIRHFGLCNYGPEALEQAIRLAPVATLQTPLSLLRREYEHGLQDVCRAPDGTGWRVGVLAYEPLCRGLLSGKFRSTPTFRASDMRARDERFQGLAFLRTSGFVAMLEKASRKVGVPTAALAIGWVCSRAGVTSALVGAKRPEQVVENVRAAALIENEKFWQVMDGHVNAFQL